MKQVKKSCAKNHISIYLSEQMKTRETEIKLKLNIPHKIQHITSRSKTKTGHLRTDKFPNY